MCCSTGATVCARNGMEARRQMEIINSTILDIFIHPFIHPIDSMHHSMSMKKMLWCKSPMRFKIDSMRSVHETSIILVHIYPLRDIKQRQKASTIRSQAQWDPKALTSLTISHHSGMPIALLLLRSLQIAQENNNNNNLPKAPRPMQHPSMQVQPPWYSFQYIRSPP